MAWDVHYENGIYLPQIDWWLDPQKTTPRAIVSHGHSDHIGRHREIVCTLPTSRFIEQRLPGRRTFQILPFASPAPLTLDCRVTLFPAGHILGSALVLLEHSRHGTLLYTGDFKLRAGRAAEPCATPRADVLITESTFGLPRYVMPPAAETEAAILAFCRATLAGGVTPVLHAYSLGKSQALLRLLGDAGLPAALPAPAARFARLYAGLGMPMPDFRDLALGAHSGHVVIAPAGEPLLHAINPKRTAAVTGWALDTRTRYRLGCDEAFPLSDHSDFPELLAFIEHVRPLTIYTVHGFAREFAATLRQRGHDAWALGLSNQLELALP